MGEKPLGSEDLFVDLLEEFALLDSRILAEAFVALWLLVRLVSRGDSLGAFGFFRLAILASVETGDSSTFLAVDDDLTEPGDISETDRTAVEELDRRGDLTGVNVADLAGLDEFDRTGVNSVDLDVDEFDLTGVANVLDFLEPAEEGYAFGGEFFLGVLGGGVMGAFGENWCSRSIVLGVSGDMGLSLGSWQVRGGELKFRLDRFILVGGEFGGDSIDISVVIPQLTFTASFSRYLAMAFRYFSL